MKWPCFYGIDFATRAELIANGLSTEEIATSIGADSLGYISLDGMIEATTSPADRLCRACFDGVYPIELPDAELLGKHLLEIAGRPAGPHRRPVAAVARRRALTPTLKEHSPCPLDPPARPTPRPASTSRPATARSS